MTKAIPALLGLSELAALAGWNRHQAAVYRSRGLLPEPHVVLKCGPVWRREDVQKWLAARQRPSE